MPPGRTAKLNFWVLEGRGKARQMIRVFKDHRRVATISTPLRNVSPFRVARAQWRVPRGAHGHFRFSVRSIDAAGNKSRLAWASLDVR